MGPEPESEPAGPVWALQALYSPLSLHMNVKVLIRVPSKSQGVNTGEKEEHRQLAE